MVGVRKAPVLTLVQPPAGEALPPLDDTELLAALRAGDGSAARALYVRARPQVDRTILRLLRARGPDHEDLVQVSLIELVGSMGRFRGECSLDTWISRISARAVYAELRRRRSHCRLLAAVEQTADAEAGHSGDLDAQLGARATLSRIQHHLDAMELGRAWTVVLHDVCGYDLREISEITGVSVAAAQSRLVRGRADLHGRIERDPQLRSALERRKSDR